MAIRRGLSIWLVSAVVYLAVGAVVQALGLDPIRYRTSPPASWPFRVYGRFDAAHFLGIARYGYYSAHKNAVAAAYFPGYPLAGRTLARLFSVGPASITSYLVALCLIAWVGTASAAVLLWRLTEIRYGQSVATAAVVVLLAGPYSVFLVSSYSEGPFLALALGAWVAAKADRWLLASACAALAAFTRISGLFLGCALVVLWVQTRRSEGRPWRALELAALSAPFLSVVGYFAWLHAQTGHWDTWFRVERRGWGRRTVTPVKAFTDSVHRIFTFHEHGQWAVTALRFQAVMEVLFAAAFVAGFVALVRRRSWAEATFVGLTAASLLTSAYYLSVPRDMLTCFPIAVLVGDWAVRHRGSVRLYAFAAASVLIALFNASSMLSDHWAG